MEATIALKQSFFNKNEVTTKSISQNNFTLSNECSPLEKAIILFVLKIRLFFFSIFVLKNPKKIWRTYKKVSSLRKDVWGGEIKKIYRVGGKYYFTMYSPGWPSKTYDTIWKSELRRHSAGQFTTEKTNFAFFAITRKCPMRCEHCFEWDNLNHRESFSKEDLMQVLDHFVKEGIQQFHFSGGEPMVRFKDLLQLVKYLKGKSICWIVTSGFNCTEANARLLKEAGCTGVVVSIDHYVAEMHNTFRGHKESFTHAINAVRAVKAAGMVSSISVCVTKSFIEGGHLQPYLEFAKQLGVQFVQLLEPRAIGHYNGQNVLLEDQHIRILEDFFTTVNHSKSYRHYPTILYHGYHQRRVGCFAGSRSIYIDSAGDVHSCPFCHTKSYNIIDLLKAGKPIPQKENVCPLFEKIA